MHSSRMRTVFPLPVAVSGRGGVCLGGGGCPAGELGVCPGGVSLGGVCVSLGVSVSRRVRPRGVCVQGGLPRGCVCPGGSAQGCTPPVNRMTDRQV